MLRVLLRYWLLAVLLAVVGMALHRVGRVELRAADAHRRLLTLDFEGPLDEYDAIAEQLHYVGSLPGFTGVDNGLREQRATSSYWRRRFDELALKPSVTGELTERNPVLLLLAANAAYRHTIADETGPAAVQRLETVLGQYADVLRRAEWQFDAAYNYEYVARRRDALIRARAARTAEKREVAPPRFPDTIHGRAGSVPPGTDMSEFKIIVPQRSDERREQPEAGKGGAKARKG